MTVAAAFTGLFVLVCLAACTSSPESTAAGRSNEESVIFRGVCDGSAAVKLDDETILVAYDESNTLFAFAKTGGLPVASVDLAVMLNLKTADEMDIEAATVSDKHIWWTGSHSLDKNGIDAPNRHMLFATSIPSADLSDLVLVSQPVDLIAVLLKSEKVAKVLADDARNRLPKEGGINIEGLVATTDGGLLVGFRSPLNGSDGASGNALVVKLFPVQGTFEVQEVNLLDLANRGIRDFVHYENRYMIVAGPVESGGEFALYIWDGQTQPEQTMKLNDLNAEGILDLGSHWLTLSDDGKAIRADNEARDGYRTCDRIYSNNSLGGDHASVFFHAEKILKKR
ncbi:MAG: DUF3616 domain-containing protein [Arenicellales bacterium]